MKISGFKHFKSREDNKNQSGSSVCLEISPYPVQLWERRERDRQEMKL